MSAFILLGFVSSAASGKHFLNYCRSVYLARHKILSQMGLLLYPRITDDWHVFVDCSQEVVRSNQIQ